MNHSQKRTAVALAAVTLLTAACTKKTVSAAPPPSPTAATARAATPKAAPPPTRAAAAQSPAATMQAMRSPNAVTRARIDQLLAKIEDAYFDYNKSALRPDALKALQADSTELRDILKDYRNYQLTIEGHADERGSAEYNLALGDRRASAAKEYLAGIGIPSDQLKTLSYGKEKPLCQEHYEDCWSQNRRIHIVAAAPPQH